MSQGLISFSARHVRNFAPSFPTFFFDHGRALDGKSDVEVHRSHVRQNFTLILKNKLYANLKECIYGASVTLLRGYIVGKNGVRPDSEKIKEIPV